MTADKLLKCIAASVKHRGGLDITASYHRDKFRVPTRHGLLEVTPYCDDDSPWIAMRFVDYSTGKVFDTLGGVEFNGYSGKWNINPSGEGLDRNEAGRKILRDCCLQEFERRMEAVKLHPFNPIIIGRPKPGIIAPGAGSDGANLKP